MPETSRLSPLQRWRELGEGHSPLFSEPMIRVAFEHLGPALGAGSTVLDLGCGLGHVGAVFHAHGARALGLDADRSALLAGRRRHPGPSRIAADQAQLPLRAASVDAVYSFSSLQYSDRSQVLAECRRVLRPGVRLAIVENLFGNPFARLGRWLRAVSRTPYPEHLTPRRHLRWSERTLFAQGFRDVRFETFHVLTPVLLAMDSMASEPVGRPGDSGWRALYARLHRWDAAILRRWPGASAAAWSVVVCAVR